MKGNMKNKLMDDQGESLVMTSGVASNMKNKLMDDQSEYLIYCDHAISPTAESWGGYQRYWCEPCFCAVVPPVPWSEILEDKDLYPVDTVLRYKRD